MKISKEQIISRIDSLLKIEHAEGPRGTETSAQGRELYTGTMNLVSNIYGSSSPQMSSVIEINERLMNSNYDEDDKNAFLVEELKGTLKSIKDEINHGLLESIQKQAKAEILADFIYLAKHSLDEGNKDVAAVLSCAALEDTLKKYADNHGLEVEDKDMSDVINSMKAKGLLHAPQAKVLKSYVAVRNKAFHAEWGKIDSAEVHSVIGFVQDFIVSKFAGEN